jgi:cytochrome c oxidase subunit 3
MAESHVVPGQTTAESRAKAQKHDVLHSPHSPYLAHHFDNLEQQFESARLGMWAFLATEVMFFGGLIAVYTVYRSLYPEVFAEGSHHLPWLIGAFNTGVLLVSSLCMALAVHAAQVGKRKPLVGYLLLTIVLGSVFLGIKAYEYYDKYHDQLMPIFGLPFVWDGDHPERARVFYSLYFAMTGLHALHMVIGIGVLAVLAIMAWRRSFSEEYFTPVEMTGLYWHFVDIVWVFLYPLLYLIA